MAKKKKKKKHRLFWFLVKLQILLMLLVFAGVFYYNYSGYAKQLQEIRADAVALVRASDEKTFVPSQTSIVYAEDGQMISYVKGEKEADYVEYQDIPGNFISAMVSIEDKRYYEHNGIDFVAILRSAKAIIETKSLSQGGSTITMQLARTIFLDNGKRFERKIKEMFTAAELEKVYSKNKIMEYYLNNIYFANGYYGIVAACRGYFSCELKDLSLSQTAFLCAIPNSPTYYDPIVNYENTIERRNRILTNMYEDGKIEEPTYLDAINEEIVLVPSQGTKTQRNNYVDTYVYYCAARALMELQGFEFQEYFASEAEKQEYYKEYDELYADCQKQIFAEGYQIYTSIQLDKQQELQNAVNEVLSDFTETGEDGVYEMQAAAVCIDNNTGYVSAIVGGREQEFGFYTLNRAYQSYRQPGSSIKPLIVYTPFFELGNNPETTVTDEAIEDGPKAAYYYGEVTTRFAVQKSLNAVAWKLFAKLTPEVGLSYLKSMHFSQIKEEDYVPAAALGGFTKGVSALEMAAAYAALENDGIYRSPSCIKKIEDADGNVIYTSTQLGKQVYKATAARMMTDVLVTAIEEGTGKEANIETAVCAGKTGTTNDYKDGWFVGYSRYYTTSVWVGCDLPKSVDGLKGASYPAQIWKNYMSYVHQELPRLEFLPYAQLSDEFVEENNPQESETQEPPEEEPLPENGADTGLIDIPEDADRDDTGTDYMPENSENSGTDNLPENSENSDMDNLPENGDNPGTDEVPENGGTAGTGHAPENNENSGMDNLPENGSNPGMDEVPENGENSGADHPPAERDADPE